MDRQRINATVKPVSVFVFKELVDINVISALEDTWATHPFVHLVANVSITGMIF